MDPCRPRVIGEPASDFFIEALARLDRAGLEYMMGGGFAYSWYSGVGRATKDLDVFVRRDDVSRALELFREAGYRTEIPFPHWLGKVHCDVHSIDVIFSSGNGVASVDDLWFEHAQAARMLGRPVRLCPPEEMIWSKAFVQERERFDGADVLHLFRALGSALDWERLLMRFGNYWRVLLSHVILFGFAYPGQRSQIPTWVIAELMRRFAADEPEADPRVCYGTILSREQYLWDIEHFGYRDARLEPHGQMTQTEADIWTAAIEAKE
jgi:Uncharacterised nucleotidyltransferase